jgi:proton-translocating NADH-quinone oxidoreductase chain N
MIHMTPVGPDLVPLMPVIVVVLTGIAALAAQMLGRPCWAGTVTVLGLLLATALALPLLSAPRTVFMGTYRIDTLSVWAMLILLPATALVAVLATPEVRGTDREGAVYGLLALTAVGALMLAGAGDMMFLVLGVLLSSLGSFALVAYPRTDRATEAAMKYFVFGSVSEAAMNFGLTFWFGALGSTLLGDLGRLHGALLPATAGLVAVVIGLGYKAALVPFHFWAPDAYDGAPVAVAAYLSIVPKVGAVFGLAQVLRALPVGTVDWPLVLAVLAVVSMTYGNLAALVQTNVVRLLAYSSIAQVGYFLLGIVALGHGRLAVQALVVFAAAYAAMNLGAFAVVARVGRELETFTGLGRSSPWTGGAMAIFLFSLVGVPPLGGFVGKLLLFGAAIDAGYIWLAVIAILNSVLSLAVYLRIIVPMYQPVRGVPTATRAVVAVGAVAFVLTWAVGLGAEALVRHIA